MKSSNRPVIVDTNILFSALLTNRSKFAETLLVTETLELNGLLWTGDKILKEGLLKKGFQQFFDY
jgi:predicted nucleic acid-binding protein